jgi:hypothetical protein
MKARNPIERRYLPLVVLAAFLVPLFFWASVATTGASVASVSPLWTVEGNQSDAWLGWHVAKAGDVNGDGYTDLIVGVPRYDGPEEDEGAVYVYHGGPSGPSTTYDWSAEPDQAGAVFGTRVAGAGDVNNDGYDDIVVSAQYYTGGNSDEGAVFVYHGGPSGLEASPSWTIEGEQDDAAMLGAASNGDINADGYSDIVVSALFYDDGFVDNGRAYCYMGGPSGLSSAPVWTVAGDADYAYFGYDLKLDGDVNGDGYSDLVVSALGPHDAEPDGRVFVYFGGASGLSATPDWTGQDDQWDTSYGGRVAYAGDVNNDGYSDIVVGATGHDNGQTNEGAAFLYHGGPSGPSLAPDWMGESNQEDGAFGGRVAGAGDIDGDGFSDVLVTAHHYSPGRPDVGRVYLFFGSASGLETDAGWALDGAQSGGLFGIGLCEAGDQYPGGNAEIVIGAPYYNLGHDKEGAAFIYTPERIEIPIPEPAITSAIDHPQDQGKQVILSWAASSWDASPNKTITHYSVWRKYLGGGAVASTLPALPDMPAGAGADLVTAGLAASGWEYVADQESRYLDEYAMTVPTYADSTASGIPYTGYIVIAHTYDRWTFYVSEPDSGYSVDNLAPECPAQLVGQYSEGEGVRLEWLANSEPDVDHYAVYRSADRGSDMSEATLLGTTEEPAFVDADCGDVAPHYKVTAYDKNGNEGSAALLAPGDIEGAPWEGRTYADLLFQNVPNPFLAATDISFSMSKAGHVRLTIYDAMGRRVRVLVDGHRTPSHYVEVWDGRDDSGRAVASGAYFYLLETPGWAGGKKMMLTR